jgi:ABC-2 type transport system permease protein
MSVAQSSAVSSRRYSPLAQLVLCRVREFIREPEALFWVYGFPIVMTVALGIAFRNQPVEQQYAVDVIENPKAEATQKALTSADHPERFKVEIVPEDQAQLHLRTGKADLIALPVETSTGYELRFDPTRSASVLARNAVDDQLQRASGRRDVAEIAQVKVEEPGGRYIDFLVPGLLGLSLMGGGLWGLGFVTVDMRIRKLLKRFLATPMKKSQFLGGLMISRLIFMVPEVLFLLGFSRLAFGVVNHGSMFAVAVIILLGAVMFAGIGLLTACRANTIEAVSGLMNLVQLPMWIASGVFFSSERFPDAVQPVIRALPLTAVINSLRSVMLEGASLGAQLPRIGVMVGWGVVSFVLALRWFRWR